MPDDHDQPPRKRPWPLDVLAGMPKPIPIRLHVYEDGDATARQRELEELLSKALSKREPASQLFICYSHNDAEFARQLARDLESLHVQVWLDEWELEVGDALHTCVGEALEKSDFVGVVLLRGVADHQARAVQQPCQRRHVDGDRVDHRDAAGPRDLYQGEVREVRPLAVELGVEPVGGLVQEPGDQLVEPGAVVDPERLLHVGTIRGRGPRAPPVRREETAAGGLIPPAAVVLTASA